MIQELTLIDDDNASIGSSDAFGDDSAEARASFIGKKITASAKSAQAESKNLEGGSRHVGFQDAISIIPEVPETKTKEAVV